MTNNMAYSLDNKDHEVVLDALDLLKHTLNLHQTAQEADLPSVPWISMAPKNYTAADVDQLFQAFDNSGSFSEATPADEPAPALNDWRTDYSPGGLPIVVQGEGDDYEIIAKPYATENMPAEQVAKLIATTPKMLATLRLVRLTLAPGLTKTACRLLLTVVADAIDEAEALGVMK